MNRASCRSEPGDGWRRLGDPDDPRPVATDWGPRLADFIGPALARHLLGPSAGVSDEEASGSRLMNRFLRAAQSDCLRQIADAGIEIVALKGFALAHSLYPDPDLRITGDLDILVHRLDLEPLLRRLSDRGYGFRAGEGKPWGFISKASYLPFVSADGAVNLDIHIEPDCYPLYRALTGERLFAAARPLRGSDDPVLAPCPEHSFLLLASNAAKDKFGPFAVKKLVDALVMLRAGPTLDWPEIERLASDAALSRPLRTFLALLDRLASPLAGIPAPLQRPPRGLAAGEFRRLCDDQRCLFAAGEPAALALLRREALLCTQADVLLAEAVENVCSEAGLGVRS